MDATEVPGAANTDSKQDETDIQDQTDDHPNGPRPKAKASPKASSGSTSTRGRSSRTRGQSIVSKKAPGGKVLRQRRLPHGRRLQNFLAID